MKIKITLLLFLASLRRGKELPANAAIEIMIYAGFNFSPSLIIRLPLFQSLSKTHLTHFLSPPKINLINLQELNLSNPIKPINVINSDTFQSIFWRQEETMSHPLRQFVQAAASQVKLGIKLKKQGQSPREYDEKILSDPRVSDFIKNGHASYGENKFLVLFYLSRIVIKNNSGKNNSGFLSGEHFKKMVMDYYAYKKASFVFEPPIDGRVSHATVSFFRGYREITVTEIFKPL